MVDMSNRKHLESAIVLAAVAFLVLAGFYSYSSVVPTNSIVKPLVLNAPPSVGVGGGIQPIHENVTVLGTLKVLTLAPTCSLAVNPCSNLETQIFYVVVNGRNYRLILADKMQISPSLAGSSVVVSGLFVTPSTFQADQWVPALFFFGDIHVRTIWFYNIY
jgi:hypothetical protein